MASILITSQLIDPLWKDAVADYTLSGAPLSCFIYTGAPSQLKSVQFLPRVCRFFKIAS